MTRVSRRALVALAVLLTACGEASVEVPPAEDAASCAPACSGADAGTEAGDAAGQAGDSGATADAADHEPDAAGVPDGGGANPQDAGAAPPDAGALVTPGTPGSLYAAASSTCANMPLRTSGTVYYFCDCKAGAETGCVAGDDANPGTSPSAPKRRWWEATHAVFNAMNGGDTVALCRGGAWSLNIPTGSCGAAPQDSTQDATEAYLSNPRCAAGASLTDPANPSTCDIRDYQAPWGGTNKPLLAIPESNASGMTMILARNGGATAGVRVMNLEFRGHATGAVLGSEAQHQHVGFYEGSCGPTTDTAWLICGNTFRELKLGMQLSENGATPSRMRYWGNRFIYNWLDAILGGPGAESSFDANYFEDNGETGVAGGPAHTIYPNGQNGSPGAQIVNNEIRYVNRTCGTAIISGHGPWEGLNFENNLIDGGDTAGCWGTKLDSGNNSGSGPHYQRNIHFHRNWIRAASVGIGIGQSPGALVENNVVVMSGSSDWKRGILIPSEGPFGWDITSDVTIRNNTVYLPIDSPNAAGIDLGGGDPSGTGQVFANNAVHAGGSMSRCFSLLLDQVDYAYVGHNACYQGSWGTTYDATTHVTDDLLFTNPPTDFTPLAGSPLIGAGSAAHAPAADFALKSRPSLPAIGAFEP